MTLPSGAICVIITYFRVLIVLLGWGFEEHWITLLSLNEVWVLVHHVVDSLISFGILYHLLDWDTWQAQHLGELVILVCVIFALFLGILFLLVFLYLELLLHALYILKPHSSLHCLPLLRISQHIFLMRIRPLLVCILVCNLVCRLQIVFDMLVGLLFVCHLVIDNLSYKPELGF